jgi:hypothetical protein
MPRIKTPIKEIRFKQPNTAFRVETFIKEIKPLIEMGGFIAPGFTLAHTIKPIEGSENTLQIITLTYEPTKTQKDLQKKEEYFDVMLSNLDIHEKEQFHIIFETNDTDDLVALATDLDARLFRYLCCFCPSTGKLKEDLFETDYWIMNTHSEQNKLFFTPFLSEYKVVYQIFSKQGLSKIIGWITNSFRNLYPFLHDADKGDEEKKKDSTGVTAVGKTARFVYKNICARTDYPYKADYETFCNPLSDYNIEYNAKLIPKQLQEMNLLPKPEQATEKEHVLFVGCGTGRNLKAIADLYPHWYCYGVDPHEPSIKIAIDSHKVSGDQLFIMTLQELGGG